MAYAAMGVTVRVGFGHLMDRWGNRRVAILALTLYVLVMLACLDLHSVGLPLIGAGLGVAHGAFYPAFNAVAVATAGPNERGKVMALFQASFHVGFSGGAFALGVLAEAEGYPAVFQAGAACLSVALLLLLAPRDGRAALRGGAG